MATILVTGASGTVGKEVVKALSSAGHSVKAALHTKECTFSSKVGTLAIDFTNMGSLQGICDGVDQIFFLTPASPTMANMTQNLVTLAKKAGVKHIVKLSVVGAEIKPGIQFQRWHRESEKILFDSGIRSTFLRPTAFMQNFLMHSTTIKRDGTIISSCGTGKVPFIHAADIAACAAAVMSKEQLQGKAYVLTGGSLLSHKQVAELMTLNLNKTISYLDVPDMRVREHMKVANVPRILIDAILELNSQIRSGMMASSTTVVEKLIGRRPISFDQFIRDNAKSFS